MASKILQALTSRPHSILHTQIAMLPLRTWVTSFYIHFDKLCHLHAWPFLGTSTRAKDEFDWRQLTPMCCPRTQGVLQRAYLQSEITSQDLAQVENGWRCKFRQNSRPFFLILFCPLELIEASKEPAPRKNCSEKDYHVRSDSRCVFFASLRNTRRLKD